MVQVGKDKKKERKKKWKSGGEKRKRERGQEKGKVKRATGTLRETQRKPMGTEGLMCD